MKYSLCLACALLMTLLSPGLVAAEDPPNPQFDPELAREVELLQSTYPPMAPSGTLTDWVTSDSGRRYNEVRQKSSHNSYKRQEALMDQLIYHRVRSLELDIHIGKSNWPTIQGSWYVYHVNGIDAGTTCHRLVDCFSELTAFGGTQPSHEVVTVWIDVKDDWSIFAGHQPEDLDTLIDFFFSSSRIFRPSDLMAHCPTAGTLQQAVSQCGWPLLTDLRGKFIFVLTGGDPKLDGYASNNSVAQSRSAFIAPSLGSGDYAKITARDYAVFFNTDYLAIGSDVNDQGFVGRAYTINSSGDWSVARSERFHHLATDKVNFHEDGWARTHNANGWPFDCFYSCSSSLEESVPLMGVEVNSEDIWGSSDHFRFLYEYTTANNNLWTASVSSPNSHVDDWAKGCLMARYSTASNSPYFAMCRPADENKLRIQWRSSFGGGSSKADVNIVPSDTVDQESLTHIRLYVYNNNTCAAGYGSQSGASWTLIGYRCFNYPLHRQGVGTSSHGNDTVKILYANLKKNSIPVGVGYFPNAVNIGTVRSARAFDGPFPPASTGGGGGGSACEDPTCILE